MHVSREEKLRKFVAWFQRHITGDEKGQAQIFLDRLFQAFGLAGCLDVGGTTEFRVRKSTEDGGGTSFADYVWKPVVLVEMKTKTCQSSLLTLGAGAGIPFQVNAGKIRLLTVGRR